VGRTTTTAPGQLAPAPGPVVKATGAGERLVEGPTKTGRSRGVDLEAGTVAALRACRAARGGLALDLVRDPAFVLSNLDGSHRHPERFSRRFAGQVAQARKALGEERLPVIRLHHLRHTHAALADLGHEGERPTLTTPMKHRVGRRLRWASRL
jgi:integrase